MKDLSMGRPRRLPRTASVAETQARYGGNAEQEIDALLARLEVLMRDRLDREPITSHTGAGNLFVARLANLKNEQFHVAFLDSRHRIIAIDAMFQGSIDSTQISIRTVIKEALRHNAAALILAHNHPSGVTEPSLSDRHLTAEIKRAVGMVDIRLLDHIVVGGMRYVSMAEMGLI